MGISKPVAPHTSHTSLSFPTPDSRLPTPDSRLPTPDSRLPTPDSRLPTPYFCKTSRGKIEKNSSVVGSLWGTLFSLFRSREINS
ncbi:hypothetical protein BJP36_39155 [Moorena producens JHB]|uniref:Uncharacterized protein n=1 Tax=Moorena producens (strain JHB) TaxID=1454205 RepID=A0A9Q9UWQ0_MOOP1|nr:hypothetical protein [Moorena producens]WAN70083.1 hypothetical protein BJP36_39155 [Moorena producens JHB]